MSHQCVKCNRRLMCLDSRSLNGYTRRRYICICGQRYTTREYLLEGKAPLGKDAGIEKAFRNVGKLHNLKGLL